MSGTRKSECGLSVSRTASQNRSRLDSCRPALQRSDSLSLSLALSLSLSVYICNCIPRFLLRTYIRNYGRTFVYTWLLRTVTHHLIPSKSMPYQKVLSYNIALYCANRTLTALPVCGHTQIRDSYAHTCASFEDKTRTPCLVLMPVILPTSTPI